MLFSSLTWHQNDSGVFDSNFSQSCSVGILYKAQITSSLPLVSHRAAPLMTFTFFLY